MHKNLKLATTIILLTILTLSTIVALEYIEIIKSKQRIRFANMVQSEQLSNTARKAIYLDLKADQCGFIEDIESVIISFFVGNELEDLLGKINELISKYYLLQEKEIGLDCKITYKVLKRKNYSWLALRAV